MAKKITAKDVAAIYRAAQHKIETVPGYREALERVLDLMGKIAQPNYVDSAADREQLDQAMGDLMLIEFEHKFGFGIRKEAPQ
jgi:hypothetical protein